MTRLSAAVSSERATTRSQRALVAVNEFLSFIPFDYGCRLLCLMLLWLLQYKQKRCESLKQQHAITSSSAQQQQQQQVATTPLLPTVRRYVHFGAHCVLRRQRKDMDFLISANVALCANAIMLLLWSIQRAIGILTMMTVDTKTIKRR